MRMVLKKIAARRVLGSLGIGYRANAGILGEIRCSLLIQSCSNFLKYVQFWKPVLATSSIAELCVKCDHQALRASMPKL